MADMFDTFNKTRQTLGEGFGRAAMRLQGKHGEIAQMDAAEANAKRLDADRARILFDATTTAAAFFDSMEDGDKKVEGIVQANSMFRQVLGPDFDVKRFMGGRTSKLDLSVLYASPRVKSIVGKTLNGLKPEKQIELLYSDNMKKTVQTLQAGFVREKLPEVVKWATTTKTPDGKATMWQAWEATKQRGQNTVQTLAKHLPEGMLDEFDLIAIDQNDDLAQEVGVLQSRIVAKHQEASQGNPQQRFVDLATKLAGSVKNDTDKASFQKLLIETGTNLKLDANFVSTVASSLLTPTQRGTMSADESSARATALNIALGGKLDERDLAILAMGGRPTIPEAPGTLTPTMRTRVEEEFSSVQSLADTLADTEKFFSASKNPTALVGLFRPIFNVLAIGKQVPEALGKLSVDEKVLQTVDSNELQIARAKFNDLAFKLAQASSQGDKRMSNYMIQLAKDMLGSENLAVGPASFAANLRELGLTIEKREEELSTIIKADKFDPTAKKRFQKTHGNKIKRTVLPDGKIELSVE